MRFDNLHSRFFEHLQLTENTLNQTTSILYQELQIDYPHKKGGENTPF